MPALTFVQKVIGNSGPILTEHVQASMNPGPDGEMNSNAMLKSRSTAVRNDGGVGRSVNALDLALRKALCVFYPNCQTST